MPVVSRNNGKDSKIAPSASHAIIGPTEKYSFLTDGRKKSDRANSQENKLKEVQSVMQIRD